MLPRVLSMLAALLVGGAYRCGQAQDVLDVPHLFPETQALKALTGVYPGISVDRLRKLRPAASEAPYIGLKEVLAGDTVRYRVTTPTVRQSSTETNIFGISKLLGGDHVEGIDLWQPIGSADSALRSWRKTALLLRARLGNGQSLQCFTITRISGVTRFAIASADSISFGVALIEESHQPTVGGVITIPAIVDTFVTSRLDSYAPTRFARVSIPCP